MNRDISEALKNVNMTYKELVEIADGMVKRQVASCDEIIADASMHATELSNEDIRNIMLKLALASYSFSETKEKSSLTAECAEILRKEAYAKNFVSLDGPVATKENTATMNISNEILVEAIYNLVASLLKTKLDECHRCVDVLKSILMSRMSEAKLTNISDALSE